MGDPARFLVDLDDLAAAAALWSHAVSVVAEDEGWNLFSTSDGYEVMAESDAFIFSTDLDAIAFVEAQAAARDGIHRLAINIHRAQARLNAHTEREDGR